MDHHYHVGAGGHFDGFTDQYTYGRRANGIYVPRFRNLNEKTKQKDYVRGFGFQGGAGRGSATELAGIGAEINHYIGPLR